MMSTKQAQSLFAFASALGYHVLLHRNSGKPYFRAIMPMFGTCNILDITQMQFLHNYNFNTSIMHTDSAVCITLRSSGKKPVIFHCYWTLMSEAIKHKQLDKIHLLWNKQNKKLILNG